MGADTFRREHTLKSAETAVSSCLTRRTNSETITSPVFHAKGHILINGLGIGMVLAACLRKPDVSRATVIEIDPDVVALFGPAYADPRVEVVTASAFEYQPPNGIRYGMVWHDIWDDICGDNLPEMTKLKRKYGRRADWQGCWCEWQCRR
jgi:spermidine synthase